MIKSVAIVREMYESFAQGDLDRVKNCFSETVDVTIGGDLPYSGKYTNYSQVEDRCWPEVIRAWPHATWKPLEYRPVGDTDVIVTGVTGIGKEEGPFITFMRVESSKIILVSICDDEAFLRRHMRGYK